MRTQLKTARFHRDSDLVPLYKSKLLEFLEYRTPVLYHASDSVLTPLDNLQNKLLRPVGCSNCKTLLLWNLASLSTRRDMAMLGLVHGTVLEEEPTHFRRFFTRAPTTRSTRA